MIVGFDYWQVISHYPEQMLALKNALADGGHEACIVSAIGKNRVGTVKEEAHKLGFYVPVFEVVFDHPRQSPELKLAKCQELGIEMFFDDRDDVCRLLNKNGIMALRVTRKDNSTYDLGAERHD